MGIFLLLVNHIISVRTQLRFESLLRSPLASLMVIIRMSFMADCHSVVELRKFLSKNWRIVQFLDKTTLEYLLETDTERFLPRDATQIAVLLWQVVPSNQPSNRSIQSVHP